jgi:hypothetical protein
VTIPSDVQRSTALKKNSSQYFVTDNFNIDTKDINNFQVLHTASSNIENALICIKELSRNFQDKQGMYFIQTLSMPVSNDGKPELMHFENKEQVIHTVTKH